LPYFFFLLIRSSPTSTLFPYTTLFRSELFIDRVPVDGRKTNDLIVLELAFDDRLKSILQLARIKWITIRLPELPPDFKELASDRSEEHTSELQSRENLVCRLLLEKKKK